MEPYQQRVVDEKTELDEKLNKLRKFIGGETFVEINLMEQHRLRQQHGFMVQYSQVLQERIDAFTQQNAGVTKDSKATMQRIGEIVEAQAKAQGEI